MARIYALDFGTFSKLLYIRPLQNEVLLLKFFGSFFQERMRRRRPRGERLSFSLPTLLFFAVEFLEDIVEGNDGVREAVEVVGIDGFFDFVA